MAGIADIVVVSARLSEVIVYLRQSTILAAFGIGQFAV